MSQNTSHAVMQQRIEPHDSLDDFPTPPWATRALCEHVLFRIGRPEWNASCPDTICHRFGLGDAVSVDGALVPPSFPVNGLTCWEPACNRGHMVKPLTEYFGHVWASDVHSYGFGAQGDFLIPGMVPWDDGRGVDWIITNPPFRLAQQFIERGRDTARVGVAVIVRSAFLEGVGRYSELFRDNPPNIIAQFTERVVMVKGRLEPKGSTATAYCWLVWINGDASAPRFVWIPPCRRKLERPGDYEARQ